jgi:hypothetical protein
MSATSIDAMEGAVWSYLGSLPGYQALGLREYRAYLGDPVPFDPQGRFWSGAALPLIGSDRVAEINYRRVSGGFEDELRQRFRVVVATQQTVGAGAARSGLDAAMRLILGALTSDDAQRGRLGAPTAVAQHEIEAGRITAWPSGNGSTGISAWEWDFTVRILSPRRQA